jgi:hypothetical protein
MSKYIYIHIYIHIHMYIYIHIYISIGDKGSNNISRAQWNQLKQIKVYIYMSIDR